VFDRTGNRASTVILVSHYVTKMIELKRLSRAKLADAKLLSTLMELIIAPSQSRFANSLLSTNGQTSPNLISAESPVPVSTIKPDEPLSEAEELKVLIFDPLAVPCKSLTMFRFAWIWLDRWIDLPKRRETRMLLHRLPLRIFIHEHKLQARVSLILALTSCFLGLSTEQRPISTFNTA